MELLQRRRKVGFIVAALSLAYVYQRKINLAKKKKTSNKKNGENKADKKNPMFQIFWILWPFGNRKGPERSAEDNIGQVELVAIFLVSVLRTWHQNRMVYIKRDLLQATYRRDAAMFRSIIKETIILSGISSLIFAVHRFLKERLTLVWREKLTKRLHQKYFHAMNYYKISHLNKNEIADVEERLTKDPRRFCKGLADEMEKLSASITSGIWFTYKLTTISSLPYAVSPLIYFYFAFRIAMTIAPDWSKRWRKMLDLSGIYFKSQNRLQTHAEAISAYQGNVQERAIIVKKWDDFCGYARKFVYDASIFQFVTAAFFEYGGHSFAEALIVGKFMAPNHPAKDMIQSATSKAEKVAGIAYFFSEVRFVTEYFIRAMSAQGTVIAVLRQLQNMKGPAKRLTQLIDTLDKFEDKRKAVQGTRFKSDDNMIKFENVQVFTPLGHLLVKDLNFHIEHGTSMLLTGVNGSGKSSIFRCLGSLWNVPEPGVITKPGGNEPGLNKLVFYLPQKPYNVLGTLRDQIFYPDDQYHARKLTKDDLIELLNEVDLGYLISRDTDEERNWENELSLGEKQRLAMARLLYHNPKYAILDECTSGVSAGMERRLYEVCKKRNITCITISHRPVLEKYHDVVLNILADGKGGWSFRKIEKNALGDVSGATVVGGYSKSYLEGENSDALVEKQRREKRSAPYRKLEASRQTAGQEPGSKKLFNKSTWQRLKDIMIVFFPNGVKFSEPEFRLVLKLILLVIGKTLVADAAAKFDGYIVATALQSDFSLFLKSMTVGAVLRTILAYADAQMFNDKWFLNLEWRKRLSSHLMNLYFTGNTFYDVKNHDSRIPDPEDRITEQVSELCISLTELWTSLLKPAFDIGFNTIVLYRLLGVRGVTYTTGYMALGFLFLRFVIPNFREIQKKSFELEGRFRFIHNRLIEHTESIAFFGGDEVEHAVANKRFDKIRNHFESAQTATLRFNIFNNFTIKQTPDIVAFFLRMMFAKSFHSDKAVLAGDQGSMLSSQGEYIQQTVMRSFKSFGDAFDLQETIGNFIGTIENVTDFMYTLEELAAHNANADDNTSLRNSAELKSDVDCIKFEDVDIVAPGGLALVTNLNMTVRKDESLVLTGVNGSGKSSLFRIIGGLWRAPKGRIYRPCSVGNKCTINDVFLVPQRPYSVTGSLADQLSYPFKITAEEREENQTKLQDLLDLVGIRYLLKRYDLWETELKWEDVLSLGEQQRLNCARLFFHKPKFAILDECTSAVSSDVEERLYRTAKEKGITSITISQRLALEEFHVNQLKMGDANGDDGWVLETLRKEVPVEIKKDLDESLNVKPKTKSQASRSVSTESDVSSTLPSKVSSDLKEDELQEEDNHLNTVPEVSVKDSTETDNSSDLANTKSSIVKEVPEKETKSAQTDKGEVVGNGKANGKKKRRKKKKKQAPAITSPTA
eukprot:snap_masked-scaffold_15-processed-gene-3.11-mRNA-1 protein AED:0.06 eAED:0.06 QI:0/0/0/0.5/1/1/2/0/1430